MMILYDVPELVGVDLLGGGGLEEGHRLTGLHSLT